MGQKVHPTGLRLGIIKDWESRWFSTRGYTDFVLEDEQIRRYLRRRFARGAMPEAESRGRGRSRGFDGGVGTIEIERAAQNLKVTLHTAKPGIIIGRGGRGVDDLRADIERLTDRAVHLTVQEVRQPELQAQLVAESIASQIEKRIAFKRAVRQAVGRSTRAGAKGIKVICAGRLGGAEMARRYSDREGKIPLHTLRADIDYGFTEARTPQGHVGIKVWVYRGDILPEAKVKPPPPAAPPPQEPRERRRPKVRRVSPEEVEAMRAEAEAAEAAAAAEAGEPQAAPAEAADVAADAGEAERQVESEAAAAEPAQAEPEEEHRSDVDAAEG
jgi:small subunit ribosomal protein S3